MSEKIEEAKKKFAEENEKNKKIAGILKIVVYVITAMLLINMVIFFILGIMMDKNNYFIDHISMPVSIILFGAIAILLTQINPKVSRTSNTNGDKLELIIGTIICLVGIGYLIYEIATA